MDNRYLYLSKYDGILKIVIITCYSLVIYQSDFTQSNSIN